MKMTYEEYCDGLNQAPCTRLYNAYQAWSAASDEVNVRRDVLSIAYGRIRYEGYVTVSRIQRRYHNRTGREVSPGTVRQILRGDGLKVENDSATGEKIDATE